jgi:hypothetical protein
MGFEAEDPDPWRHLSQGTSGVVAPSVPDVWPSKALRHCACWAELGGSPKVDFRPWAQSLIWLSAREVLRIVGTPVAALFDPPLLKASMENSRRAATSSRLTAMAAKPVPDEKPRSPNLVGGGADPAGPEAGLFGDSVRHCTMNPSAQECAI